jgi:hypothetical protein
MHKKALYLVFIIAIWITACNNKNAQSDNTTSQDATLAVETPLPNNFYKRIEGTIAAEAVTMHLHAFNGKVTGVYYYNKIGQWIVLNGKINEENKNTITLTESNYNDGEDQAILELIFNSNNQLLGSWKNKDGSVNYVIQLKENYPEGSYRFNTYFLSDSIQAYKADTAPKAVFIYNIVTPIAQPISAETNTWLSHWIYASMEEPIDTLNEKLPENSSLEQMVNDLGKQYLRDYKNYILEASNNEITYSASMEYESFINAALYYNENGLLILGTDRYDFSGGAHGNSNTLFYCMDVANKKILSLNDVLQIDSPTLQPIVEAAFRKQQHLAPTDSLNNFLFENSLALTSNFYFTNKGIGFYYNQYEVAPYAVGPIMVYVPFEQLKKYVKPQFAQRIKWVTGN